MHKEKQISKLQMIINSFNQEIDKVTNLALESKKGGDQNWYKLLKEYNIKPSSEIQKQMYFASGMPVEKGAVPAELRKAYQTIRKKTIKNYQDTFQNIELTVEADLLWDNFLDHLKIFINEKINTYIGKIKQKISVNDIFANAFSSMNKFSHDLEESKIQTKKCKSCGAPRQDEDQYDNCYFCGTKLFETIQKPANCQYCHAPRFEDEETCSFCGK